ncbi:MAG: methyl-accepting chemotaxis protein [Spirochaetales bacterium]|nr:methyl-accepting chemotaxis protein [Spirochaetales bacterium]
MTIGRKLTLLIAGIILMLFVGGYSFIAIYLPVRKMQAEKESLFTLDSVVLELRANVNKLSDAPFGSQSEIIIENGTALKVELERLEGIEVLKQDVKIAASLKVISNITTLYEVNYMHLLEEMDGLNTIFMENFYTKDKTISELSNLDKLDKLDEKAQIVFGFEKIRSITSTLDSNLTSTHMVILEQFAVIEGIISDREAQAFLLGIIVIVVIALAAFIAAFLIARKISGNVKAAGSGIRRLSEGDISCEISISSKDEIGELSRNLNSMIGRLKQAFNSMKEGSTEGVALKEELIASASETSAAAVEISTTSRTIEKQFTSLGNRVTGASEANQQMAESLLSLEGYVQEQTAMVEQSTSSVTEMISSINSVADITLKKRAATEALVRTAESGGAKLKVTTGIIREITGNLDEIKGTAAIIQQIASQTNLLAMNAAIEAAHAGDSGRGFAVVADEIRKLAEASSKNSKQISGVLKEVVGRIETAGQSSHETEAAFSAIDTEVQGVSQSLEEINASMDELKVGGHQILEAMSGLQDVSVKVGSGSEVMKGTTAKVSEAIDAVERITVEVSGSASEIHSGISEVSSAMSAVTELSERLGDITDRLEREASLFKTEVDESGAAEDFAATVPDGKVENEEH